MSLCVPVRLPMVVCLHDLVYHVGGMYEWIQMGGYRWMDVGGWMNGRMDGWMDASMQLIVSARAHVRNYVRMPAGWQLLEGRLVP